MNLDSELPGAVARGEIEVFFQPQIDILSGRMVAVETLSRWRHPFRGLIPPRDFITDAESSGAIHGLGAFMMAGGCRCAARWASGRTPLEVAVNVSAVQLSVPSFFDEVVETLRTTPLEPHWLTVEVTESRAILDLDVAITGLERLKSLGVGVSIDDFGTGFSSLKQVQTLPSTELKIDRSLTQSEAPDSNDRIAEIVKTAHDLGLRVVAEGVETRLQYDRARYLGCDRAQGFLFGHPVPEAEMDELIAAA
ncbi:MAG: EAL domain-containing protein [Actinomycetota bacterium]|nr:EAL domain-containing protein [Actinomycetota bacterium]